MPPRATKRLRGKKKGPKESGEKGEGGQEGQGQKESQIYEEESIAATSPTQGFDASPLLGLGSRSTPKVNKIASRHAVHRSSDTRGYLITCRFYRIVG
jgi:hypothetical protein